MSSSSSHNSDYENNHNENSDRDSPRNNSRHQPSLSEVSALRFTRRHSAYNRPIRCFGFRCGYPMSLYSIGGIAFVFAVLTCICVASMQKITYTKIDDRIKSLTVLDRNNTARLDEIGDRTMGLSSTVEQIGTMLQKNIAREKSLSEKQRRMSTQMTAFSNKLNKLEKDIAARLSKVNIKINNLIEKTKYAIASASCEQHGGVIYGRKCFSILWNKAYNRTFQAAKQFCKSQNQTLAYPSNKGELHFMTKFMWSFEHLTPHVGFERSGDSSDFVSVDGRVKLNPTSNMWDVGFPAEGRGRFGFLRMDTTGDTRKLGNQPEGIHTFACFYRLIP